MKFCPTCQTKYDEEILRFCIKDGTPLVDEKKPEFKEIPSQIPEEDDDFGEDTVIRRNKPSTNVPPPGGSQTDRLDSDITETTEAGSKTTKDSKRIVISTSDETRAQQVIRPKDSPPSHHRHQPPKGSNTALVAMVSIFGTIIVLAGMVGIFWFLTSGGNDVDPNSNLNTDENLDTNFNADDLLDNLNINGDIDANENTNFNVNVNANTRTPTPTPSETPTPTPTPTPDTNANTNANTAPANTATPVRTPTPTPTPAPTPVKTPTPSTNTNQTVNVGQINGRAISLPTPRYTAAARQARASGRVTVRVLVDEQGNVISATATEGHPLLRNEAVNAALRSKFKPVLRDGANVRSLGTIAYNFVN